MGLKFICHLGTEVSWDRKTSNRRSTVGFSVNICSVVSKQSLLGRNPAVWAGELRGSGAQSVDQAALGIADKRIPVEGRIKKYLSLPPRASGGW